MGKTLREASMPSPKSDIDRSGPITDDDEMIRLTEGLDRIDRGNVSGVRTVGEPGAGATVFEGTGLPGDEVDLTQSDRFFSPTQVATDDQGLPVAVVDPKLQMYMDEPELAQLESDLAIVRYQEPEKLEGEDLKKYEAALDRINAPEKPEGELPQFVTEDQIVNFEKQLIETKFGGVDPRTRDVYGEVYAMPESTYREYYMQNYGMQKGAPLYDDLEPKAIKALKTEVRSAEHKRLSEENRMHTEALNLTINQMKDLAKRSKAGEERRKAVIAANTKKEERITSDARKSVLKLTKDLSEAQTKLMELTQSVADPEMAPEVISHKNYIKEIQSELARNRKVLGKDKSIGDPGAGGEPGSKGPVTAALVSAAIKKHGGDRAKAKQDLIDQGYTFDKPQPEPKLGDEAAGFQTEPSA